VLSEQATRHDNDNLPDILARWKNRAGEEGRARMEQSFFVPKADIAAKNYDLSLNCYREVVQEIVSFDSPEQIIDELATLECEIQQGLERLGAMLEGREIMA
jgi:type I restriction enzyme M protein